MNLRLRLAYDGTGFRGWARQPGRRTVEGVLERALTVVYPGWSDLAVAGRTDTGVHALGQVVSVSVGSGPPVEVAARVLTSALPDDVAVDAAVEAPAGFHARHSARSRTYRYRVRTAADRTALDARRVLHHPGSLDLDVLSGWATTIVGTHDFRAFTPTETQHRDFGRTITRADWTRVGDELEFVVVGDRFLRHMVRTLVGTMLVAARGEPAACPIDLLAGAPRALAGPTAPAWALYLIDVGYDDGDATVT